MVFLKTKLLHFSRTLETYIGLPINVCKLIFMPFIVCVWPYPTVPKDWVLKILVGVRVVQKVFGVNYAYIRYGNGICIIFQIIKLT